MTAERAQLIELIWSMIETDDPTISDEMLMHRVCQTAKCDVADVVNALEIAAEARLDKMRGEL